jgi:prephenate dehydrogenase
VALVSGVGRVGVVGLGHIGGSLALALRDAGVEVVATSRSESTRDEAAAAGLAVVDTLDALAERSDVVVVAAALGVLGDVLVEVVDAAARQPHQPTVTDAGSVKTPVLGRVLDGTDHADLFVPGHPMAGNEGSGFASAVPDLFRGRTWVVGLHPGVRLDRWAAVARVALAAGSEVIPMEAPAHDVGVALTSHLPYVIAAAVARQVGRELHPALTRSLAAGSYDSLTRVAAGHPTLGAAMALGNRDALADRVRALATDLEAIARALEGDTDDEVVALFEAGRTSKEAEVRPTERRAVTVGGAELAELAESGARVVAVGGAGPAAVTVEVVS